MPNEPASNKLNFTKKALEALEPTADKQSYYYDTKTNGLALRVSPAGIKTFVLYRKVDSKPERITLGRFPDMTIEQARGQASEANSAIAKGENPADKQRTARAEMPLGELFTLYLERHAKVHKRSWQEDEAQFKRYLQPWAKRQLSAIKKPDVQTLHAKLGKEVGPYAANRLLALLHKLFNFATDCGWEKANPARGIKKFKEQSRDRFLQADELPRFFQALAEEPNDTARDYILLSLLTGARQANVLAMRWEDIHFERATWTMPTTKNGEAHTLPLVPEALTLLHTRQALTDSPWVLPGPGATGHLVEPKKAWARILERAGIKDLRLHDLRRSLGSWQAATGANLSIIGKTLAHKNVSTTAIYARLSLDPVRASMEQATQAMLIAAGVLPKAEVVDIPKHRVSKP